MFRRTSPQRPLFGVEHRLSDEKRARLERTWAHAYRSRALPLIDEELFGDYFHADNGRPNKSVRLVLSVLVLKEIFDLTDGEALEQLEWNATWQYALDLTADEAHTCQKTLHNFRAKLLSDDQGAALFEETTARMLVAAQLKTARQRLDSTHFVSNIRLLTRLGLFTSTITVFLEALRKAHSRLCGGVPLALRERYLDREGYFGDVRGSEAPRRLAESALDVHSLVTLFGEHKTVSAMAEYRLLARLYDDQCVLPEVDAPTVIELKQSPLSSSLQSPSDPDVTYGHKGKGFEAQLTETCHPDNPFEAITAVSVNGANQSDQHQVLAALDQIQRVCAETPELLHTDCGYGSGENILGARERGTELLAPIGAKASATHLPIVQFTFDADERIARCPAGHSPSHHTQSKRSDKTFAWFPAATCSACPLRDQCPTEPRRDFRVLAFRDTDVATALRRIEQETPEFKEMHKIRSGVEATNSELKRCHGLAKLRVRGSVRVHLAVRLKALALNLKRYVAHLTKTAVAAAAPMQTCAC